MKNSTCLPWNTSLAEKYLTYFGGTFLGCHILEKSNPNFRCVGVVFHACIFFFLGILHRAEFIESVIIFQT